MLQISHRACQSVLQAVRLLAFLSCSHAAAARLRLGDMQAMLVIGCDGGGGWASDGREMLGMIGPGSCLPAPSARSVPQVDHFHSPTTLSPPQVRRTASVYIDAPGLHFFFCLPTVSVLTSANISIFTHFPLQSIFVLLHVLAGPIESLLALYTSLSIIVVIWNKITFNSLSPR